MIFDDLLKLLAFTHSAQKNGTWSGPFLFTKQLEIMDEMWHAFILHTELYQNYCMNSFGEVLHHDPADSENAEASSGPILAAKVDKQIEILAKELGSNFTNRIYFLYPQLLQKVIAYVE